MTQHDRYGEPIEDDLDDVVDGEIVGETEDAPATDDGQDWPETITLDEIESLLNEAVARDQRTTSQADVLAWYQDLNLAGLTYSEASQAMSEYYVKVWPSQAAEKRFRATPGTVIEIVRKARKDRLAASSWEYVPSHPDETGPEFVANYDRQRDAVAAGHPAPSHLGQLKPRPELKELIKGLAQGKLLPADVAALAAADLARKPPEIVAVLKDRRHPALTVACPRCGAHPGARCKDGQLRDLGGGRRVHPSRTEAFATSSYACPSCSAEPGNPCVERSAENPEQARPYYYGVHKLRIEAAGTEGGAQAA